MFGIVLGLLEDALNLRYHSGVKRALYRQAVDQRREHEAELGAPTVTAAHTI